MTLEPFRLRPWFRTRIWGVRDLAPWYDFKVGEEPIGEVWLSGDDCVVDTGPLAGRRFAAVFRDYREQLLGPGSAHDSRFPLLMKVLFPSEKLSVQVHPGDEMARQAGEPHGKTECWYALEAEPGAAVALGLRERASIAEVQSAIAGNQLESLLNWVPVKQGDMIFVDAGTVHAVGPGVVLLETQQNSDMTYRLYDYGRPRELHLEDGLKAVRLRTQAGKVEPLELDGATMLVQSDYFRVDRLRMTPDERKSFQSVIPGLDSAGTVQMLFVARGAGSVQWPGGSVELRRGELGIIPACVPDWKFLSTDHSELLRACPV